MKGYKNYNEINFSKIFEEYQKNNLTQTEISKKYNIPYSTFNSRYVKWKMQYMNGGGNKKQNDSEKLNSIFKRKDTSENKKSEKEKSNNVMEVMNNMGGKGQRNKHSGFTDIIEQQEKNNKQQNKKKLGEDDLEKMYGTSKFLNNLDKEREKADK